MSSLFPRLISYIDNRPKLVIAIATGTAAAASVAIAYYFMRNNHRQTQRSAYYAADGYAGHDRVFNEKTLLINELEILAEAEMSLQRLMAIIRRNSDAQKLIIIEDIMNRLSALKTDISILLHGEPTDIGKHIAISQSTYSTSSVTKRAMSILSDDSFMSALEELTFDFPEENVLGRDLKIPVDQLELYQQGLQNVAQGAVVVRCVRTEALNCASDDDFLAKLYGVRLAFEEIFAQRDKKQWVIEEGKSMISSLLQIADKDSSGFETAYQELIDYVMFPEKLTQIKDELAGRQVPDVSFYDVVLDFILLDAFEDLAHPPAAILAVAQNRFLSASFKQSTLNTVIWSVLKAKRSRMQVQDGFLHRFYNLSEQVSPCLAWGFLGTDENLRHLCYYFKEQVCQLVEDAFSFARVRYTSVQELAEDIWLLAQERAKRLRNLIQETMLSIST